MSVLSKFDRAAGRGKGGPSDNLVIQVTGYAVTGDPKSDAVLGRTLDGVDVRISLRPDPKAGQRGRFERREIQGMEKGSKKVLPGGYIKADDVKSEGKDNYTAAWITTLVAGPSDDTHIHVGPVMVRAPFSKNGATKQAVEMLYPDNAVAVGSVEEARQHLAEIFSTEAWNKETCGISAAYLRLSEPTDARADLLTPIYDADTGFAAPAESAEKALEPFVEVMEEAFAAALTVELIPVAMANIGKDSLLGAIDKGKTADRFYKVRQPKAAWQRGFKKSVVALKRRENGSYLVAVVGPLQGFVPSWPIELLETSVRQAFDLPEVEARDDHEDDMAAQGGTTSGGWDRPPAGDLDDEIPF